MLKYLQHALTRPVLSTDAKHLLIHQSLQLELSPHSQLLRHRFRDRSRFPSFKNSSNLSSPTGTPLHAFCIKLCILLSIPKPSFQYQVHSWRTVDRRKWCRNTPNSKSLMRLDYQPAVAALPRPEATFEITVAPLLSKRLIFWLGAKEPLSLPITWKPWPIMGLTFLVLKPAESAATIKLFPAAITVPVIKIEIFSVFTREISVTSLKLWGPCPGGKFEVFWSAFHQD